ncbi:dystroglycan 1-like [Centruroides vittatus]|uniref:dystroglycan 1-like n=1 Tax=Centruroides vittatus TaxID=120091 RepID=UPI00350F9687
MSTTSCGNRTMEKLWTALLLGLFFVTCSCNKEEISDIHNYLQDLNGKESANQQILVGVRRLWGIPDTTASVGRLFNYVIPEDAFSGEVERYVVTEAGEQILPSWLYFEEETRTFRGVPTEQDIGHAYISVKAVAKSTEDDPLIAKDVFSVEIVDDSFQYTNREKEKCPSPSSRTVLTVIADANMADLPPYRRYDLITKMATIMKLETRDIKLVTLGGEKAFDEQAIVAGPGNIHSRDGAGVILKWIVGCEGTIKDTESVNLVEKLAKNGELASQLGLPIVGWHVTNQRPTIQVRMKRQNHVLYGTPVPGIVPTMWTSETIDDIEPTEDSVIPESRVVPTMSSPIYTTTTHRHRHHHSATDRGHHHHIVPSSPTFMLHSTPVFVPVVPTDYVESSLFTESVLQPSVSTPHIYVPEMTSPTPSMSESEIQPTRTYPVIEPSTIPNAKPVVENKLKKMTLMVGKLWTFVIPENTFKDFEDGDTRNLKLMFLTPERESIPQNSWIQFDPVKQELYAIPLEEHIKVHHFYIEAMDSEGKSAFERVNIRVLPPPKYQFTHMFKMTMKYYKWQYPVGIDWQMEVMRRLARLYKEPDVSSIVVRMVNVDPLIFGWSNDTLSDATDCPREEILKLYDKLATDSGVTRPLRKIMNEEFKVQELDIEFEGVCKPQITTAEPEVIESPTIRNPIDHIITYEGDVFQFVIPADTFFDDKDGITRNLTLELKTINNADPDDSWIMFDQRTQMIQAMPDSQQVDKYEFQIKATDSDGNYVSDAFIFEVKMRKSQRFSVDFSIYLDEDFEDFNKNIVKKMLVARKLARMYGDSDTKSMRILKIKKGSVVYSWTNSTLPNKCSYDIITQLVRKLINNDNTVTEELIRALQPEFKITKVKITPGPKCIDLNEEESLEVSWPTITTLETTSKPATTSDDDIYITTVIPAVVIAIMLIIAAMVACFLYRKKRKGKMTMQDTSGFMSKGVPIIFADEIEEKSDPAKPPVIMKDEKPPLSQPTYQTTGSTEPTPQIERREPQTDPPYQPPPPFTTSREAKNGRPKATPTYRQPPPYYVPP